MKEYVVYVTETLGKKVIVKAENSQEAVNKVSDQYYNEEIILTSDDYLGANFETIEED